MNIDKIINRSIIEKQTQSLRAPILDVKNLHIRSGEDILVNNISFEMHEGEVLGVVGESGSGKTLTALAITNLLPQGVTMSASRAISCGVDLLSFDRRYKQKLNGVYLSNIFQDPLASLNPTLKIGVQVEEPLHLHTTLSKDEIYGKSFKSLTNVGLEANEIYNRYPHELSGGMRQRVMIAMAMINNPALLVADEPTTALDTVSQLHILNVLKQINKEFGVSILLISHDLSVIKSICSRCVVMKGGEIVESGEVDAIFNSPQQQYTKKLLNAIPTIKTISSKEISSTKKDGKLIPLVQNSGDNILEISNLCVSYSNLENKKCSKSEKKLVLYDVSLTLERGEILGVVGESGSGKSTLALAIAKLIKISKGTIHTAERRPQIVFQDPSSSLNPAKRVKWILEEPLRIDKALSKGERDDKIRKIMNDVGLDNKYLNKHPQELSGGQKQRVCIAYALLSNSELIILDEPLSALDVTIQHQILALLRRVKDEYNLSYLFISHDLAVVSQICDRVVVLHNGRVVEEGTVEEIFTNPKDEYTKLILDSTLSIKDKM